MGLTGPFFFIRGKNTAYNEKERNQLKGVIMFGMLLGIAVLIVAASAVIWVCDQMSDYMHNENLQDETYFEFEPLFK